MNTTRRLRAFVAGTVAALALAMGAGTAVAADGTSYAMDAQLDASQTLKVTAPKGQLASKDLVAIQLGTYSSVQLTTTTPAGGTATTVISSYDVSTNATYKTAIDNALKSALGDAASTLKNDANYNANNPLQYVALNMKDSATSPYAGQLRGFLTALAKESAITGAKDAKAFGNYASDSSGDSLRILDTAGLKPGIYLILDKTDTNSKVVASIPMLTGTGVGAGTAAVTKLKNDNADLTLGEVEYKPTEPTFSKKVQNINDKTGMDTTAAGIGDTVTFTLTTTVPNWTGYSTYQLSIADTLSKGLTYKPDSISVKLGAADSAEKDRVALDEGTDWGWAENKKPGEPGENGTNINIVFGPTTSGTSNIVAAATKENSTSIFKDLKNNLGKTIFVTYQATLNKDAVIEGTGNPNDATLTYSNNPSNSEEHKSLTDKATVYTGKFTLAKTDMTGKALAGAKFTLKRVKPGTGELENAGDVAEVSFVVGTDGNARVATNADVADASTTTTKELTIPEGGSMTISGLQGTYELAESEAPSGFNTVEALLPTVTIEVDPKTGTTHLLQGSKHDGGTATFNLVSTTSGVDQGKPATVTVKNARSLLEMPKTGAAWLVLYLAAAVICGGAGSALLLSRRRIQRA